MREESVRNIAKQYGWNLITPQNLADKFMNFIETMDMSFSYKPVLLKAIYEYMDSNGSVLKSSRLRSGAMKAPVGLLSDRTVLRSKMEGPRPDKFTLTRLDFCGNLSQQFNITYFT